MLRRKQSSQEIKAGIKSPQKKHRRDAAKVISRKTEIYMSTHGQVSREEDLTAEKFKRVYSYRKIQTPAPSSTSSYVLYFPRGSFFQYKKVNCRG